MPKLIDQFELEGKKVFLRLDLNCPIKDGIIQDESRLQKSLPTIKYALEKGAKLICASHLGRPQGEKNEIYSLLPLAERLSELLEKDVFFPEDCIGGAVKKIVSEMRNGQIVLLENLRFHKGEESNDAGFSEKLSQLADLYINDAFGACHRSHASTVGMVKHFKDSEKGIGFLLKDELHFLGQLLDKPEQPFTAIIGGAKVSDKIEVIDNLMSHINELIIGGGMAYTFLKAQGFDIGNSLVEDNKINLARKILKRAQDKNIQLHLPSDSIGAHKIQENEATQILKNGDNWSSLMGLDIGPASIENFKKVIRRSKTILWNGPMGVFEIEAFSHGTTAIAETMASHDCLSVVGGGDSLAAISKTGLENQFSHLSSGGGASLEFLEGKTLPALKVLEEAVAKPSL